LPALAVRVEGWGGGVGCAFECGDEGAGGGGCGLRLLQCGKQLVYRLALVAVAAGSSSTGCWLVCRVTYDICRLRPKWRQLVL